MVDIIKSIFMCKSDKAYYQAEKTGLKRNTVRVLNSIIEDGYSLDQVLSCKYVIISLTNNTNESFIRVISHITPPILIPNTSERIIVISWMDPATVGECKR